MTMNRPLLLTDKELRYLHEIIENNFASVDVAEEPFSNTHSSLQGKIISYFGIHNFPFDKIRNNHYCEHNEFSATPLFMGGGTHSINRTSILHKRLAYATMLLGGKQQNGGMGTEFDVKYDKKCDASIRDALRDIISALGYKPSHLCE